MNTSTPFREIKTLNDGDAFIMNGSTYILIEYLEPRILSKAKSYLTLYNVYRECNETFDGWMANILVIKDINFLDLGIL